MTKQKAYIFGIILMFSILLSQFAFATELKMVKVSDLKQGDIIVDKNGNEIPVEVIATQEQKTLTISEYIKQQVYGNESVNYQYKKEVSAEALPKIIGHGSSGPGAYVTGNAVYQSPEATISPVQKLINKIKGWFKK